MDSILLKWSPINPSKHYEVWLREKYPEKIIYKKWHLIDNNNIYYGRVFFLYSLDMWTAIDLNETKVDIGTLEECKDSLLEFAQNKIIEDVMAS